MSTAQWDDLAPRLMSAVVMVVIGLGAVVLGGVWFQLVIAVVCGLMIWELARMLAPEAGSLCNILAGLTSAAALIAPSLPLILVLLVFVLVAGVGYWKLASGKSTFAVFAVLILIAGFSMMSLRIAQGAPWMVWLILVVVATDVAGYFAGRAIGGPKFWPSISPKKTWSGTAAGWGAAAIVGLVFAVSMGVGAVSLMVLSMVLSLASQMGDIAESAVKRRTGVKDSSNLIPGHGGLLDRFDGMLGAAVFLMVFSILFGFPAGA